MVDMLNLRQKERKGNNKNNRAGKEGSRTVISYIDRLNNRVSRPQYLKLKIRDPPLYFAGYLSPVHWSFDTTIETTCQVGNAIDSKHLHAANVYF